MVVAQLGEAVGAVVKCLHIVRCSILHFVGVVLDSGLISFHLAVDEATVRVYDRV